jgi:hypothetical protein
MRSVEITIFDGSSPVQVERAIERAIRTSGLQITLCTTLRQYPGCIHWHVKSGSEKGTLEITYWPAERRAWFTIHRGRAGEWIADAIKRIQRRFQEDFRH